MTTRAGNQPKTILLIAVTVAIVATAVGMAATGGFAAAQGYFSTGQGVPFLLSVLGIVGAGLAFTYVAASLLAAHGLGDLPEANVVVRPIVVEEDEQPVVEGEAPLEQALNALDRMVGLVPVKDEVKTLMARLQLEKRRREGGLPVTAMSLHMVFTGPPGVGKTEVARLIGRIFQSLEVLRKGHVVEVDRGSLVSNVVGGTAILTTERCREALDGILFIDEAYSLAAAPGGGPDFGKEAIDTVLKFMEDYRDRLVVIVAGYPQQMQGFVNSNPGLASRFSKTIDFPSYSVAELGEILSRMAESQRFVLPANLAEMIAPWITANAGTPQWGNARSIRSLLEKMREAQAIRISADPSADLSRIEPADIARATRL
jgi:Holliday junction resolvasome RuvABC ATP-dependent DNA helicase subunit